MRIWIICVLLCFLAIGCASKSGNIEQTKNILDAIGAEEKLAGEEFEITAVPSHEKEEVGFNIAVEEGKLSCDLVDADLRRTLLKIAEDAQLQFVFSEFPGMYDDATFLDPGLMLDMKHQHFD